jgi:hypothetical protein
LGVFRFSASAESAVTLLIALRETRGDGGKLFYLWTGPGLVDGEFGFVAVPPRSDISKGRLSAPTKALNLPFVLWRKNEGIEKA